MPPREIRSSLTRRTTERAVAARIAVAREVTRRMRVLGLLAWLSCFSFAATGEVERGESAPAPAGFTQPDAKAFPELFAWTDACNVYVFRDGDAALLVDLGDGSVLAHLGDLGVTRVEWVLFTHHHREQCQGAPKLGDWRARGTRVAAPEAERAFFETPAAFRTMHVSLSDATQNGHEAMVAHNSAILEEGYIQVGEYLKALKADVLVGGHSFVMGRPTEFIERFRTWAYAMRDAFQALSPDPDYRYFFDPFWVRAQPYRTSLAPGGSAEVALHVRNFRKTRQTHRIEIHAPRGLAVAPALLQGELLGETRATFPLRIALTADAAREVRIAALDVTIDGQRLGERFDFVVGPPAEGDAAAGKKGRP